MKKYIVVTAKTIQELEDLVGAKISEGYRLASGTLSIINGLYMREMTYY